MKWLLFTLTLASPLIAFAGGSSDGGGVVFACGRGPRMQVHLADTYKIHGEEFFKSIRISDPPLVIAAIAQVLEKMNPEKIYPHPYLPGEKVTFSWMLMHTYNQMGHRYVTRLDPLEDDHIDPRDVPAGCEKRQIVVQDIPNKLMSIDVDLVGHLTFLERGLLEVHETLVNMRHAPGEDTTPIRRKVEEMISLMKDPTPLVREIAFGIWNKPVERPQVGSNVTPKEVMEEFREACPSGYLLPAEARSDDTPAISSCRRASTALRQADQEIRRRLSLKTLLRLPSRLLCEPTYAIESRVHGPKPGSLVLTRVSGPGTPGSQSFVELAGLAEARPLMSSVFRFNAQPHERLKGQTDLGAFRISMEFANNWVLFLDGYDPLTGELIGSLQNQPLPDRHDAFLSFGLVCRSGSEPVEFDFDFGSSKF